ncbi:MAG: type II toxin-antitoxin system RelE family toxin [Janthinobacterium lividum]
MALIIIKTAGKELRTLPKQDAERLLTRLEAIAAAPSSRHPATTEMVGQPGFWRVRQGDWRAIFEIANGDVVVIKIGHRGEVYK